MNPKVFVSHASEDKDRFVIDFARKLREAGVDAWLDRWEMLPGDSLVEKIFEEGLKEASAVIVVLSKYSVNKPWVKEELNTSVTNKINKGSKIIPIILDDCEAPECLKSTLWESIKDLQNYQHSFDRIVSSIFGHNDKPALGAPPAYISENTFDIPGLTKIDNLVLKISCENEIENNQVIIEPKRLFGAEGSHEIPAGELLDSLEVLDRSGFIKLNRHMGPGPYHYRITLFGMNEYAKAYLKDYEAIIDEVGLAIVNKGLQDNHSISENMSKPIRLINHVLELLENNNHLKLTKSIGGPIQVYNISPTLKRALA